MALKDWRKVGRIGKKKTIWVDVNLGYDKMIYILKSSINNPKKNWEFVDNNKNRMIFEYQFQALKFAKSYMRTH